MSKTSPQIAIARPEDALTWVQLGYAQGNAPQADTFNAEVAAFNAPPPDIDESRFIVWIDDRPIARAWFHRLGNVVELRDLVIGEGYINEYGAQVLRSIVQAARGRGNILTADFYPAEYSRSFVSAGFKENTRTRMRRSLADYVPQSVDLPEGISLRHPNYNDEAAVAEMVYHNYTGTVDQEMVSSSREQAAAIIKAMFHNDYYLLDPNGTFLAVDAEGRLCGDVIVGDATRDATERRAWVMDISVAPAHRGRRLGKALLISAMNMASEHGYQAIGLMVTIGNDKAQALYRSAGFEDFGELMYEASIKLTTI